MQPIHFQTIDFFPRDIACMKSGFKLRLKRPPGSLWLLMMGLQLACRAADWLLGRIQTLYVCVRLS